MKKEAFMMLLVVALGFFVMNVSAKSVQDDIHLNIKAKNSTGAVKTGTFNFAFNISDSESNTCDSSNIVYSDSATLTTDSEGVVSYYLEDVSLNYSKQHWLCHYRDGTLQDTTKIASSPRALSVDSGDVQPDGALNLTGVTGFFEFLGSVTNRITTLFVKDINATGTVTADSFETTGGGSIGGAPSAVNLTSGTFYGNLSNGTAVSSDVKSVLDGSKSGYAKANAICDAEYSGSRLCTEGDIVEAFEAGNIDVSGESAWVSGGGAKYPSGKPSDDCGGWTYGGGTSNYGNVWSFNSSTGGKGKAVFCSASYRIACCS